MWRIFHEAVERPAEEQPAYLESACGGDRALQEELEALLASQCRSTDFLDPQTLFLDAADMQDPLIGERIGPYRIRGVIGEGGMGIVYEVEQERPFRRRAALKLIRLGMDTREVVARFEGERQALALMSHPNIAGVLDAGATDSGRPYLRARPAHGDSGRGIAGQGSPSDARRRGWSAFLPGPRARAVPPLRARRGRPAPGRGRSSRPPGSGWVARLDLPAQPGLARLEVSSYRGRRDSGNLANLLVRQVAKIP